MIYWEEFGLFNRLYPWRMLLGRGLDVQRVALLPWILRRLRCHAPTAPWPAHFA